MHTVDGSIIGNTYGSIANAMLRLGDIYERHEDRKEREAERRERKAEIERARAEREAERREALAERHDEREARYAGTLASDFVKNGWHGYDTTDAKTGKAVHVAGILDLGYQDLERDKTSIGAKTDELLKSVKEQDFYKNLSQSQRERFDREWIFKENELRRASATRQGQLVAQRAKDHDDQTMAFNNRLVAERFGNADGSYEMARDRMSVQNYGILMGTSLKNREILANPETTFDDIAKAEKWDEKETAFQRQRFETLLHTHDRLRVKALTEAGENNKPIGVYNPQQALLEAARLANALNGNGNGLRPDGTRKGTGWIGNIGENRELITEFSIRDGESDGDRAVKDADGKFIDYPSLVPGMEKDEIDAVRRAAHEDKSVYKEEVWDRVVDKAREHAKRQIAAGKSVWKDSGTGPQWITDQERNQMLAAVEQADTRRLSIVAQQQKVMWDKAREEATKKELEMRSRPLPDKPEGRELYFRQLSADYQALASDENLSTRDRLLYAEKARMLESRETRGFTGKSDPNVWVALKKSIAEMERKKTDPDVIISQIESARSYLTYNDYFALWDDVRGKRDKKNDRITSMVFEEFYGISGGTYKTALDRDKRDSKSGKAAVKALLGSPNAEYVRSGRWSNPDFEIADVEEADALVRDYLNSHSGDFVGAKKVLQEFVKPKSDAALARTFRERIIRARAEKTFDVNKAHATEDEAKASKEKEKSQKRSRGVLPTEPFPLM